MLLLRNSTKETRKKKKGADEAAADDDEPVMSEDEKQAIADQAAFQAKPFTLADAMVTLATKAEFGDYQVNAAMGLSKSVGMNPQECARQIVEKNAAGGRRVHGRARDCWTGIHQPSIQKGISVLYPC